MIRKNKGFTLIELLVAMAVLSMVLLIASNAYSIFAQRWSGRLGHFNDKVISSKNLLLVKDTVASVFPYVVVNEKNVPKYYFEGNRNGFVAVTEHSLWNPDKAAVIRLQAVQNEDFSYRLEYQEWVMESQLLVAVTQELTFSDPIVLFDNMKVINFHYLGWRSVAEKTASADIFTLSTPTPSWTQEYSSFNTALFPNQLKLDLANQNDVSFTLEVRFNDTIPGVIESYVQGG